MTLKIQSTTLKSSPLEYKFFVRINHGGELGSIHSERQR